LSRSLDEILDSPAPAGVRLVAADFLREWLDTLPRLHGGHEEEALHDYRVAMRKLRSWLRTFDEGGNKVQKQLATLNEVTGDPRDAEVMTTWLKADEGPAATHALEALKGGEPVDLAWLDARTQKTAERLQEKLSRYSLDVPLGAGAAVVPFSWSYASALRRLHNEFTEQALSVGSLEDPVALHKVRIRAKRLRYALAPLRDWPEASEAVKLLKERQDLLGELHDRHAFTGVLEELLAAATDPELQAGLNGLLARARDEGHALFVRYGELKHRSDVRLAALLDVMTERLGKRLGLQVEVVPQGA
jgi:CHAD domain-containing protein